MALSIELQPRDSGWIKLGTQQDGGYGVHPESIEYSGDLNEYGCLEASWRMRMNPKWPRSIIEQYTDVVIRDGSDPVWSGRIIAAPTTFAEDAEIVIQAQGWGQHLKDDCTDREWVIRDLSRFYNTSNHPDIAFTGYQASQANVDGAAINLPCPPGDTLVANRGVSATLDLGETQRCTRALATYRVKTASPGANFHVYLRVNNSPDAIAGAAVSGGDDFDSNPGAGPSSLSVTAASAGGRYVHVFWYYDGVGGASASDFTVQFTDVQIFTDAAYESGGASALPASTVITETLAACCPLISSDTSKITTTATYFPNFPGSPAWRYANELIDQARAIHTDYIARLSPDPVPVFEFTPPTDDYAYVVGAGEYTLLEPAAQDGRGVYSRVITEFEDAAGVRSHAIAATPTNNIETLSVAQPSNPRFTTDASDWTAGSGDAIVRDTGTFLSTPASLAVTAASGTRSASTSTFTDTFASGAEYILNWWMTGSIDPATDVTSGVTGESLLSDGSFNTHETIGSFTRCSTRFRADGSTPTITIASTGDFHLDEVYVVGGSTSVVARRGFTRTALRPMSSRTTEATAEIVAQLELDNSQYPPFKGTIGVQGRIRTKNGTTESVRNLPSRVGDNLLIEDLHDPNTGALGRMGRIVRARYVEEDDRTEIEIDDSDDFVQLVRNSLAVGVT